MLEKDYENKEKAKQINLISFLNAEYPDRIYFDRKKKEWRMKYSNTKISALSFYDFDKCTGGDNIRFLTEYMDMTFFEAVNKLLSSGVEAITPEKIMIESFEKPNWVANTDEIYEYLQGRGIDKKLIDICIRKELLFLDDRKNLVFANPKQDFYILRSTYSDFKGIRTREVYGYWELATKQADDVYIFESPIDLLSYVVMMAHIGMEQQGIYIAMGGLKRGTIEHIQQDYPPELYTYHLCVDWDNAGNDFALKYPDMNRITGSVGKDWNDELKSIKAK